MEEAAEANCDALIARALSIAPDNPEARLSLASIRMSQQRFDEAKEVIVKLYQDIEGLDSCRSLWLTRERHG
jgi:Tfp pilus assembly protein PilF